MDEFRDDNILIKKKSSLVSKKQYVGICVVLFLITFVVAFCVGYFVREPESNCTYDHTDDIEVYEDDERKHHLEMRDVISKSQIEEHLRLFTRKPHQATDQSNCSVIVPLIKELWGKYLGEHRVEVVPYYVLLSQPTKPGSVRIKSENDSTIFTSSFRETSYSEEEKKAHVPPYNAYAANGTAEGGLVYVNYGLMSDFLYLRSQNISLDGKILLIRYGKIFRANKVQLAEQYGAAGVVLYSDPEDYSLGSVKYPDSWWLPEDGVQRGTVNHLDTDPSSIGFPADGSDIYYNDYKEYLPKIPVLPISYGDAVHLMRSLDGEEVPTKWVGMMNATYRVNQAHNNTNKYVLEVNVKNHKRSKICNVIAKIRGDIESDRVVMLGNHHDAWVFGGLDPTSGTAALTEIVRALGVGLQQGWTPRRTIMLASWDAEEYGLLGSTEWCEENAQLVKNQMIAYLNVDSAVEGNWTLTAKTSAQLAHNLFRAASKVLDPDLNNKTLFRSWADQLPDPSDQGYPRIRTPASGSDFKTFIERFGVPVTDIRYDFDWDVVGRIASAPTYHSLHDNFDYVKRFVDPDFRYTATVAQVWLLAALQLTDDIVLPMNFTKYARTLKSCGDKFFKKYSNQLEDHKKDIDYVQHAIEQFVKSMESFSKVVQNAHTSQNMFDVRGVNDQLMQLERSFIGSYTQPDTKHVIYGASKWNLYRGSCFPILADHLLDLKYHNANLSKEIIRKDIAHITYHIQQATSVVTHRTRDM